MSKLIEKALLEAEQLEETMKANAKEILSSTMKEEIQDLVKESLSEEYDYIEEQDEDEEGIESEIEAEDFEDFEGLEDFEDFEDEGLELGMEFDVEDETEEFDSDELPPLDLTDASDEEVIKVFKAMGDEDGIIIKQSGDEIHLSDGEDEYLIKLQENMKRKEEMSEMEDMEETMYEIEMDEEDMEEEMTEMEDMEEEMTEMEDMEDMEDEEVMYEIEMEEGQGYDDREDERLGMRRGKLSSKDLKSMKARRDDAKFEDREMGEAARQNNLGQRMRTGNRTNTYNKESRKYSGINLPESEMSRNYKLLKEEVESLKTKNGEYKKALVTFKEKLNEVGIFNSNLAYATRLFTEHSTTKQEKVNILRRFDNVKSLKESKELYKVIKEELSQNVSSTNSKKNISEAVERKITNSPTSGSKTKLMETKVYENPQFTRIKDLMSKI